MSARVRWYALRLSPTPIVVAGLVLALIGRDWTPMVLLMALGAAVVLALLNERAAFRVGVTRGRTVALQAMVLEPDRQAMTAALWRDLEPWDPA